MDTASAIVPPSQHNKETAARQQQQHQALHQQRADYEEDEEKRSEEATMPTTEQALHQQRADRAEDKGKISKEIMMPTTTHKQTVNGKYAHLATDDEGGKVEASSLLIDIHQTQHQQQMIANGRTKLNDTDTMAAPTRHSEATTARRQWPQTTEAATQFTNKETNKVTQDMEAHKQNEAHQWKDIHAASRFANQTAADDGVDPPTNIDTNRHPHPPLRRK